MVYTVTAQDGTAAEYTLHLAIVVSQREVLIAIYNANSGSTLSWDLEDSDINNWEGVNTDESGNIIELLLSNKKLTSIPAEIGQLPNLTELRLIGNQLTTIPSEIGQLANLTILDLYHNQLTSLPTEIGQLSYLNNLDLSSNPLTSVPIEIGQLTRLSWLFLTNNQLTSIPQEVCDLKTNYGTNITTDAGVTCE